MIEKIASYLFPVKCVCCNDLSDGKIICEKCLADIEENSADIRTREFPKNLDGLIYPYFYKGDNLIKAIFALKKQHKRYLFGFFADKLTEKIQKDKLFSSVNFDFLTNVPRKHRSANTYGYDQSEILARRLAKNLNLPYYKCLKQGNKAKEQKSLGYTERFENVKGNFTPVGKNIKGTILIIDDVFTSGASIYECTRVLKKAGAEKVYAATIAKTVYYYSNSIK